MGNFQFIETNLAGLYEIESTVFGDERGYFMECLHITSQVKRMHYSEGILKIRFVYGEDC